MRSPTKEYWRILFFPLLVLMFSTLFFPNTSIEAKTLDDWDVSMAHTNFPKTESTPDRSFYDTAMIIFFIGIFTVLLLWTLSHD